MLAAHNPVLETFVNVTLWPAGPMRDGACYTNSLTVASTHPDLHLVVGFASPAVIAPEHLHAWAVDRRRGVAYEVTWTTAGVCYRGFKVPSA